MRYLDILAIITFGKNKIQVETGPGIRCNERGRCCKDSIRAAGLLLTASRLFICTSQYGNIYPVSLSINSWQQELHINWKDIGNNTYNQVKAYFSQYLSNIAYLLFIPVDYAVISIHSFFLEGKAV